LYNLQRHKPEAILTLRHGGDLRSDGGVITHSLQRAFDDSRRQCDVLYQSLTEKHQNQGLVRRRKEGCTSLARLIASGRPLNDDIRDIGLKELSWST
jgi:hypothetical protein